MATFDMNGIVGKIADIIDGNVKNNETSLQNGLKKIDSAAKNGIDQINNATVEAAERSVEPIINNLKKSQRKILDSIVDSMDDITVQIQKTAQQINKDTPIDVKLKLRIDQKDLIGQGMKLQEDLKSFTKDYSLSWGRLISELQAKGNTNITHNFVVDFNKVNSIITDINKKIQGTTRDAEKLTSVVEKTETKSKSKVNSTPTTKNKVAEVKEQTAQAQVQVQSPEELEKTKKEIKALESDAKKAQKAIDKIKESFTAETKESLIPDIAPEIANIINAQDELVKRGKTVSLIKPEDIALLKEVPQLYRTIIKEFAKKNTGTLYDDLTKKNTEIGKRKLEKAGLERKATKTDTEKKRLQALEKEIVDLSAERLSITKQAESELLKLAETFQIKDNTKIKITSSNDEDNKDKSKTLADLKSEVAAYEKDFTSLTANTQPDKTTQSAVSDIAQNAEKVSVAGAEAEIKIEKTAFDLKEAMAKLNLKKDVKMSDIGQGLFNDKVTVGLSGQLQSLAMQWNESFPNFESDLTKFQNGEKSVSLDNITGQMTSLLNLMQQIQAIEGKIKVISSDNDMISFNKLKTKENPYSGVVKSSVSGRKNSANDLYSHIENTSGVDAKDIFNSTSKTFDRSFTNEIVNKYKEAGIAGGKALTDEVAKEVKSTPIEVPVVQSKSQFDKIMGMNVPSSVKTQGDDYLRELNTPIDELMNKQDKTLEEKAKLVKFIDEYIKVYNKMKQIGAQKPVNIVKDSPFSKLDGVSKETSTDQTMERAKRFLESQNENVLESSDFQNNPAVVAAIDKKTKNLKATIKEKNNTITEQDAKIKDLENQIQTQDGSSPNGYDDKEELIRQNDYLTNEIGSLERELHESENIKTDLLHTQAELLQQQEALTQTNVAYAEQVANLQSEIANSNNVAVTPPASITNAAITDDGIDVINKANDAFREKINGLTPDEDMRKIFEEYAGKIADAKGEIISSVVNTDDTGTITSGNVAYRLKDGEVFTQRFKIQEEEKTEASNKSTLSIISDSARLSANYKKMANEEKSISDAKIKYTTDAKIKIDNIQSEYKDVNVSKPIKDEESQNNLNEKYGEIETKISNIAQQTGAVSAENVAEIKKLTSELDRLAKGYRNAEYAANQLRAHSTEEIIKKQEYKIQGFKSQVDSSGISENEKTTVLAGLDEQYNKTVNATSGESKKELITLLDLMDLANEKLTVFKKASAATGNAKNYSADWNKETTKLSQLKQSLINTGKFTGKLKTDFEGIEKQLESIQNVNTTKALTSYRKELGNFGVQNKVDIDSGTSDLKDRKSKTLKAEVDSYKKIFEYTKQIKLAEFEKRPQEEVNNLKKLEDLEVAHYETLKAESTKYDDIIFQQKRNNELAQVKVNYDKSLEEGKLVSAATARTEATNNKLVIAQLKEKASILKNNLASKGLSNTSEYTGLKKIITSLDRLSNQEIIDTTDIDSVIAFNENVQNADVSFNNINSSAKEVASTIQRDMSINDLTKNFENLSLAMQKFKEGNSRFSTDINLSSQYDSLFSRVNSEAERTPAVLSAVRTEWAQFTNQVSKSQLTGKKAGDEFKRLLGYLTERGLVNAIVGFGSFSFNSMIQSVNNIDKAMTELKRVTSETSETYRAFLNDTNKQAQALGSTITDVVQATSGFAKLGYDLEQANALANNAILYSNVGDLDIASATSDIVSAVKAFNIEAEDSIDVVNKFNIVGNNYAITASAIGEGLKKSASSLYTAGNDLNQSIAMVTAITEITQDADSAGNALKTLSMRIRGTKVELEAEGEDVDSFVTSTAKMQSTIKALTGVDIMLDTNTFKDTYTIMQEISKVYDTLNDKQKAGLIEALAGKTRANQVSSLLNNFSQAEAAMVTMADSSGSALRENEKYLDSIQGRVNQLKTSAESIALTIVNSDFAKTLISMGTGLLNVSGGLLNIGKFVKDMKVLSFLSKDWLAIPIILTAITAKLALTKGGFSIFKNESGKITNIFAQQKAAAVATRAAFVENGRVIDDNANQAYRAITNDKALMKQYSDSMSRLNVLNRRGIISSNDKAIQSQQIYNATLGNASTAAQEQRASIDRATESVTGHTRRIRAGEAAINQWGQTQNDAASQTATAAHATNSATNATKTFTLASIAATVASTALNMALTMGISALISLGIGAISHLINAQKELKESSEATMDTFNESKKTFRANAATIEDNIDKYTKLSKGVNVLGANVSLSSEEFQEYIDITNQIAEMYPSLVESYDATGNAILSCRDDAKALNDELEKAKRNTYEEVLSNNDAWKLAYSSDGFGGQFGAATDSAIEGNKEAAESLTKLRDGIADTNSRDAFFKADVNAGDNEMRQLYDTLLTEGAIDSETDDTFRAITAKLEENQKVTEGEYSAFTMLMNSSITEYQNLTAEGLKNVQAHTEAYTWLHFDKSSASKEVETAVTYLVSTFDEEMFQQFTKDSSKYDEFLGSFYSAFENPQNGVDLASAFTALSEFDPNEESVSKNIELYKKFMADLQAEMTAQGWEGSVDESVFANLFNIEDSLKLLETVKTKLNGVDLNNDALYSQLDPEATKAKLQSYIDDTFDAEELNAFLLLDVDTTKAITSVKELQAAVNTVISSQKLSNVFDLGSYSEEIDALQEGLSTLETAYTSITDGTATTDDITDLTQSFSELLPYANDTEELGKQVKKLMGTKTNDLVDSLKDVRENISDPDEQLKLNNLIGLLEKMGNSASGVEVLSNAFNTLTASYTSLAEIKKSFNEDGFISLDSFNKIITEFPDMIDTISNYMSGTITADDLFAELDKEYAKDRENYKDVLIEKLLLSDEFYQSNEVFTESFIQSWKDKYGEDLTNCKNYEAAKDKILNKTVLSKTVFDEKTQSNTQKDYEYSDFMNEDGTATSLYIDMQMRGSAEDRKALLIVDSISKGLLDAKVNIGVFTDDATDKIEDLTQASFDEANDVVGEAFKKYMREYEHMHNLGLITDAEYYKQLTYANDTYYKNSKDHIDDYYSTLESLQSGWIAVQDDEYSRSKQKLDEDLEDKIILHAEYYDKLRELNDTTYGANSQYGGLQDTKDKYQSNLREIETAETNALYDEDRATLDKLNEQGYLTTSQYTNSLRILWEKFYKNKTKYAEESYEKEKELMELTKTNVQEQIDTIQVLIDKNTETTEAQKEAVEQAYDEKIDAIDETIDKLNEENDATERATALEKAKQAVLDAGRNKVKKIFTADGKETFEIDTEALEAAQEELEKLKKEDKVIALEKDKTVLEDAKETELTALDDALTALNTPLEQLVKILSAYLEKTGILDSEFINGVLGTDKSQDAIATANTEAKTTAKTTGEEVAKITTETLETTAAEVEMDNNVSRDVDRDKEQSLALSSGTGDPLIDAIGTNTPEAQAYYDKLNALWEAFVPSSTGTVTNTQLDTTTPTSPATSSIINNIATNTINVAMGNIIIKNPVGDVGTLAESTLKDFGTKFSAEMTKQIYKNTENR